ncbi:MAG: MFS transporter [Dehalococcoidia bacterium]
MTQDISPEEPSALRGPPEAPARRTLATFSSLRYRDYRLLWTGQVGHSASLWMEMVIRPVLILHLTDSALQVGLVVATRMVPTLLFGLIAGVVADRFDKRRILLACQTVTMSMHFLLAMLVLSGMVEVWQVFATAFVSGTSMAFNQPARQSLVPRLVPERELLNAIALNTAAMNVMRIAGGGLAGVLLIPLGVGAVYLLNGFLYIGVMLTTVLMRVPPQGRAASGPSPSWVEDLKEGFAFVGRNPAILYILAPALILFVFGFPYNSVFVPLLAKQVLDLGDSGVGALLATTGVGALAGSLVMASRSDIRRRGLLMLVFLAIFSGALILLSRSTFLPLALLALLLVGSAGVSYMALTNTLLLENSPRELHGRVLSLMSLDRGLVPLGATIAGALAATLGPQSGLLVMALICLGLTAVVAVGAPTLRRLG